MLQQSGGLFTRSFSKRLEEKKVCNMAYDVKRDNSRGTGGLSAFHFRELLRSFCIVFRPGCLIFALDHDDILFCFSI